MINLIEALRMCTVALLDKTASEETVARRRAALAAAQRVLDTELDSFLFGEGMIEVTLRTVRDGKMYANRQYIRTANFRDEIPQADLVAHGSAILWEEIEGVIERRKK